MHSRESQRTRRRGSVASRSSVALRPCRAGGFTLLEMTLVLAVIVLAAGLSWPVVQRSFEHQQLRQAAELVQVRMMAARVHALDTGVMYQFRFEPGGRKFLAVPCEQDPAAAGSIPAGTVVPKLAGKLPESVQFEADLLTQQQPMHVAAGDLTGIPDAGDYEGVGWGSPVLFRPDGTSTAGEVRLVDKQKRVLRLAVRPLTGGVTILPEEDPKAGGS